MKDLGIFLAMEFIAHAGFLGADETRQRYLEVLGGSSAPLDLLARFVAGAALPADSEGPRVSQEEMQVLSGLVSDGVEEARIRVLSAGATRLADVDLSRLAFLSDSPSSPGSPRSGGDVSRLSRVEWKELGDRCEDNREYFGAFVAYLMEVIVEPTSPTAWADVGLICRRRRQHEAAAALFRRARDLDPTAHYPYRQTAYWVDMDRRSQAFAGQPELADLLYRKALLSGSVLASIVSNLAINAKQSGKLEAASQYAVTAARLEPDSRTRAETAAKYCARAGVDPDDAFVSDAREYTFRPLSASEDEEVDEFFRGLPDAEVLQDRLVAGHGSTAWEDR